MSQMVLTQYRKIVLLSWVSSVLLPFFDGDGS